MGTSLTKRYRPKGRFDFKPRDWQLELEGLEDPPRVPLLNGFLAAEEIV